MSRVEREICAGVARILAPQSGDILTRQDELDGGGKSSTAPV
jgi:hypothetical protein